MAEVADNLNAVLLPIPTAQRLDVFVCDGVSDEALARWTAQAGTTTFWHYADCIALGKSPASFCGIALFAEPHEQLQPFYARAGSEANVFQWQPIERNFVRRDRDWFVARQ